jgi:hypothetical protein
MEYVTDEKNKRKAVLLSLEEFSSMEKQIEHFKMIIEELQDELDGIEADKIRKEEKETIKFNVNDYVSNRNRTLGSKNLKKTSGVRPGKNRKVYS